MFEGILSTALLLALSGAFAMAGSYWIERLYDGHVDILSFPKEREQRGRFRKVILLASFFVLSMRYMMFASGSYLALLLAITGLLLLMTVTDFEQYCLFDQMMLPLFLCGVVVCILFPSLWLDHVMAAAAGFVSFLILSLLTRGALGGGDIKLLGSLGLILGMDALLFVAFTGIIFGGVSALLLLLLKMKSRKSAFAYGPYFTLVTLFLFGVRGL